MSLSGNSPPEALESERANALTEKREGRSPAGNFPFAVFYHSRTTNSKSSAGRRIRVELAPDRQGWTTNLAIAISFSPGARTGKTRPRSANSSILSYVDARGRGRSGAGDRGDPPRLRGSGCHDDDSGLPLGGDHIPMQDGAYLDIMMYTLVIPGATRRAFMLETAFFCQPTRS